MIWAYQQPTISTFVKICMIYFEVDVDALPYQHHQFVSTRYLVSTVQTTPYCTNTNDSDAEEIS